MGANHGQAKETVMDDLPEVKALIDQVPLPRFTFTWPDLILESYSTSATSFLPPLEQSAVKPLTEQHLQLTFDQVFRVERPGLRASQDLVELLVGEASKAEFGNLAKLVIKPYRYHHPCTTTIFFSKRSDGSEVVQMLLLSPVVPVPVPMAKPELDRRQSAAVDDIVIREPQKALPVAMDRPMTEDEAIEMLEKVTQNTHNAEPTAKGRKHLTEDELRYLVDVSTTLNTGRHWDTSR